MSRGEKYHFHIDIWVLLIYLALTITGLTAVYSTTFDPGANHSNWLTQTLYGKQLLWLSMSFLLIVVIYSFSNTFYERFAGIIYLAALALVGGLFLFGTTIKGQTNWYQFGSFSLQPSEFVKPAVALAVAKVMSEPLFDMRKWNDFMVLLPVVLIPALMIALLPDMGTAIIFGAFILVFLREGMYPAVLWGVVISIILFILTIKFGAWVTWVLVFAFTAFISYLNYRKSPLFFRRNWVVLSLFVLFFSGAVAGSSYAYHHILKKHQKDRLSLWLRMEKDKRKLRYLKRDYGYNNDQSVKAISLGGWSGKGLLKGERTRGDFVPEQHTDYIFSAIAEEFGFFGAAAVIVLFVALILRLLLLAEMQRSSFSKIYGYSVAAVIFVHFVINIGMVTDLLPTVGIPLPFISYGGSSLWGFTLLLFIFLRLDAYRAYEL